MKHGIHPQHAEVAFRDRATGRVFVTWSSLVGDALDPMEVGGYGRRA
ncbi:50S ribosomal protein L31 [Actinopolymorpha pittospori]|uniref:Ribosomal protein L31 n=1 Tax=Actinopolymorpha pittospori TaxID=648752 RepID=A0A927REC5_9ACTN|nr:50S ribosomal protein L31 [Actinopolymorpha pittospori]MBE1609045.1 ribosomal protein L31 [Actinopolymorpha pittospori]